VNAVLFATQVVSQHLPPGFKSSTCRIVAFATRFLIKPDELIYLLNNVNVRGNSNPMLRLHFSMASSTCLKV